MSRRAKRIVGMAIVVLVIIELIPVWLLQRNPPVIAEPNWDRAETRALAQRACFDCHSNETVWPLYGRIAPMSWLVTYDALAGREELNFSEWNRSEEEDWIEESVEKIAEGEMPPRMYLLLHPEARLSASEQQELIAGLLASRR